MLLMSWMNTSDSSEKLRFIGDWLKSEFYFSELCERYQVSRKTGYKLVKRYKEEGEQAFQAKSHSRHYHPNAIAYNIQQTLLDVKIRHPKWGPEKLRTWLQREKPEQEWPATSTISDFLKKHGMVKPRKYRKRTPAHSQPFLNCDEPNKVWSADFKGQFRVGDNYCYPLTITDNCSRFLFACSGFLSPNLKETTVVFNKVFKEYGLPEAIRTDNGQPFAGIAIGGLTRLSIWWLKLGIMPERIKAGCPQQNGRHERMHRTLKEATASPAEISFKKQQNSFDRFRKEFNNERPHQALGGKRPNDIYVPSRREFTDKPPELVYPDTFTVRRVRTNGEIKCFGKNYFVSELLHGEPVALEMVDDDRALLYFSKLKLGIIDARRDKIIRP